MKDIQASLGFAVTASLKKKKSHFCFLKAQEATLLLTETSISMYVIASK